MEWVNKSFTEVENLIKCAGEESFFVGKADKEKILSIEKSLGVKLPKSYKWFLYQYGDGGVQGIEIIGNGLAETPNCVESTMFWRNYGLPESYVVIEDDGTDWIYCLDTARISEGECPVVVWEQGRGTYREFAKPFLDFLIYRFSE